ncbi:hypothetical protein EDC04DRAFT_283904 [Pisolithus marmoratus]|nr:hypothetical protein EDC04DRAFT_283904 [Pisolithus marmoratus]
MSPLPYGRNAALEERRRGEDHLHCAIPGHRRLGLHRVLCHLQRSDALKCAYASQALDVTANYSSDYHCHARTPGSGPSESDATSTSASPGTRMNTDLSERTTFIGGFVLVVCGDHSVDAYCLNFGDDWSFFSPDTTARPIFKNHMAMVIRGRCPCQATVGRRRCQPSRGPISEFFGVTFARTWTWTSPHLQSLFSLPYPSPLAHAHGHLPPLPHPSFFHLRPQSRWNSTWTTIF